MRNSLTIARRELSGYFATPVAYVFIVVFLVLNASLAFFLGNFFERAQADLQSFFMWHTWLYLFLIPAISMRLWAEERRQGTIELLLTLPISVADAVVGKFLAAWAFTGIALALTFPMWLTVNWLGQPDNGVILASYVGSFLMAGAFLAIGAAISAITKSQVIAFVLAAAVSFLFAVAGSPVVLGFFSRWAPQAVLDAISGFSFLGNFQAVQRGVFDLTTVVFFGSMIALFLFANAVIVELRKAR
ncbi:MAG: ABC transporter permease subunit [Alphaproteobacteria bacterium]|nr:ABC transporter permease subunit [Alphaproteobacteria bacterium]